MDDFTMLLPMGILDESGLFLEEPLNAEWPDSQHASHGTLRGHDSASATPASSVVVKNEEEEDDLSLDDEDSDQGGKGKKINAKASGSKKKSSNSRFRLAREAREAAAIC